MQRKTAITYKQGNNTQTEQKYVSRNIIYKQNNNIQNRITLHKQSNNLCK